MFTIVKSLNNFLLIDVSAKDNKNFPLIFLHTSANSLISIAGKLNLPICSLTGGSK
jgi:hypothetical protein